jgi:hypothetical protein
MPRFKYEFQRNTDHPSGRSTWQLELHDPRTRLTVHAQIVEGKTEPVTPTFYGEYPESVARKISEMEKSLVAQAKDRDTVQFRRPKIEEFERFMRTTDEMLAIEREFREAKSAMSEASEKVLLLL